MKTLTKSVLVAAILASGVAGAAVTPGNAPDNCPRGAHARAFGHHKGGGFERMMERLNVTPEQRTAVRAIVDQSRPQFRQLRDQMVENHKQLRNLIDQGNYDEAQVQQLAQAEGNLKAQMIVLRTKVQSQIRGVLTDQQREQLKQFGAPHGYQQRG